MRISIIGNNACNGEITDGGRIKIRLYKNLLEKEGYDVNIIELEGWKRKPLRVIFEIKRAIKRKDRIIIMAGPTGCRKIIPIVNFFNRKKESAVVFCPLGIGTLDHIIKKMPKEKAQLFLSEQLDIRNKDKKMKKMLSKMEYIVLENTILLNRYKSYYQLSNLIVLENFRDLSVIAKDYPQRDSMQIVFLSRVKEYKGILDLMQVVKGINSEEKLNIKLDIFGENQLTEDENRSFNGLLDENIIYRGTLNNSVIIDTLKKYDLFCLPTKYHGEGTSGALIESMIAGTPVLVSAYSQAVELIDDGVTGFIYEFGSNEAMRNKILWIYKNKGTLRTIGINAQKEARRYTYEQNKDIFLNIFAGN